MCSAFEQNMIADRWRGQRSTLLTIIMKPDTVWQGFIRRGKHRPFMLQKPPLGAICVFLLFPPEKQRKTHTNIAERQEGRNILHCFKVQVCLNCDSPFPLLLRLIFGFLLPSSGVFLYLFGPLLWFLFLDGSDLT